MVRKGLKYLATCFGALVGIVVILGMLAAGAAIVYESSVTPNFVNEKIELDNRLAIPPLLESTEENGTQVFSLTLQKGDTEIFKGVQTETWGANGTYLMPTIRVRKGDNVEMHVTNELGQMTTIHWHGMHLPAAKDGVHQIIDSGETWEPDWEIRQQAATLWYHPHLMGKTGEHVYNGLAGMFILEDANSENLDIPKEYGVDDIPFIIQDREFDSEGQLIYRSNDSDTYGPTGMLGNTILVNGTYAPYVDVPAGMIRLRILNGSNARRYNFGFDDNRTFYQIASDGGFLEHPVPRTRMTLAVAERAEILVDMSDLEPVTLMSYEIDEGKPVIRSFIERVLQSDRDTNEMFKIVELRPQKTAKARSPIPERLNTIQRFEEAEAAKTRTFVLGQSSINNKKMEIDRVDEIVLVGTKEIWEITNPSAQHHPFHVHDVQFQILDRNGKPPPAYEQGWKDTVHVAEDETVRVMMEFKDYTDPHVSYMFHCHMLEHEDHGMMGQYVVVDDLSQEVKIHSPLLDLHEMPETHSE